MAVVESDALLSGNKPTRQWDAWTREEEENFFGALRQVGKNFEKITSRVQTKNKDQVRHYYYRVIKRMNKILSPSLVLDAKNSSYVNSAMLRWWSLLEKHSCSASKLRLKPRRFKTFVTALEHQLLKDRKKPRKKSPPSGSSKKHAIPTEASDGISIESGECTTSGIASSKAPVDEFQSSQSVLAGRKSAVKRKAANNGSRKSGAKSEAKRPPRPRKKPADGKRSKAANGKSETEGRLGVTDMADAAAELLERDAAVEGNLPDSDSSNTNCKVHPKGSKGATSSASAPLLNTKDTWPPLEIIPDLSFEAQKSMALLGTRCNNCSSLGCRRAEELKSDNTDAKLKLQLFPFDERIRKALEQDGLNPHLELTLKARKSISSVLNHLMQKWGRSSVATGDLRLFPFSSQWSCVAIRQSWSNLDSDVSAADVHAALGNPAIFRLKYAWFPSRLLEETTAVLQQGHPESSPDALGSGKALQVGNGCSEPSNHTPQLASTSPSAAEWDPSRVSVEYRKSVQEGTFVSVDARSGLPPEVPADAVMGTVSSADFTAIQGVSSSTSSAFEAKTHVDSKPRHPIVSLEDSVEDGLGPRSEEIIPFITCEAEVAPKASCKLPEGAAQLSGCGWLYESTDGFAQQLWNIEDSLRSNQGVCMTQMDWVDSLTNISVSELLGDGLVLPARTAQNGDTFDIPLGLAVQEQHLEPSSSAIWGGEETCDAFSFQKASVSDYSSKGRVNPLNHELSVSSLGLDTSFRNMAPLSWREQLQGSQSQDILFGGEASLGLGGLIEALAANGSLDGFQAESFGQHSEEMKLDSRVKQVPDVSTKSKEGNIQGWDVAPRSPKIQVSLPMTDVEKASALVDNSANITSNLSERASNHCQENIETVSGSVIYTDVSEQARESDVLTRPASCRPQRQTGNIRQTSISPPEPFKLSGRYTNMRSLKLQT